jgi:hypothetical protein
MKKLKNKITAILLIIAFTQKMGLGLFVHAWLHEKSIGLSADCKNSAAHFQNVKCSCIEDAMIPFTNNTSAILIISPVKYFFNFNNPLHFFYSSASKIYYSLRGPPATQEFFNTGKYLMPVKRNGSAITGIK